MGSLLGPIYNVKWQEKGEAVSVGEELQKELDEINAKVSYACVTTSKMTRTLPNGQSVDVLDKNGKNVMTKSILLVLVSKTEKNEDGEPAFMGNTYKSLSRKSSLQEGDRVNIKTLKKIIVSKVGEPDKEFFDADKAE